MHKYRDVGFQQFLYNKVTTKLLLVKTFYILIYINIYIHTQTFQVTTKLPVGKQAYI